MAILKENKSSRARYAANTTQAAETSGTDPSLIIMYIRGGLGNQLFQYATGYALAKANNATLKIKPDEIYRPDEHWNENGVYQWQLPHYKAPLLYASSAELRELNPLMFPKPARKTLRYRLAKLVPKKLRPMPKTPQTVYEEGNTIAFKPEVLTLKGSHFLKGFFPSFKYFHHLRSEILTLFQLCHSISYDGHQLLEQIRNSDVPIAVHFRRGDFVTHPAIRQWTEGISTPAYYNNAVAHLLKQVGPNCRAHIFAFSDDIEWVKENFNAPCPITFVDHSTPFMGYEDIYLMSQCKHHVLSGFSSFSFWGAYLCENPEQLVMRPRKANNDPNLNFPEDLYLPEWIIAESA